MTPFAPNPNPNQDSAGLTENSKLQAAAALTSIVTVASARVEPQPHVNITMGDRGAQSEAAHAGAIHILIQLLSDTAVGPFTKVKQLDPIPNCSICDPMLVPKGALPGGRAQYCLPAFPELAAACHCWRHPSHRRTATSRGLGVCNVARRGGAPRYGRGA